MKTERFIPSTATAETKSSPPRVILEWPNGFDYPAVIYPIGGSDEIDDAIRRRVRKAFDDYPELKVG